MSSQRIGTLKIRDGQCKRPIGYDPEIVGGYFFCAAATATTKKWFCEACKPLLFDADRSQRLPKISDSNVIKRTPAERDEDVPRGVDLMIGAK